MRQEAQAYGATGWVRNLSDGRVEAVICGEQSTLQALLDWSSKGPPMAMVNDIETQEIPAEAFTSFEKRN